MRCRRTAFLFPTGALMAVCRAAVVAAQGENTPRPRMDRTVPRARRLPRLLSTLPTKYKRSLQPLRAFCRSFNIARCLLRVAVSAVLRHILPFMFEKPEGEPTWRRDRERLAGRKVGRAAGPRKECASPCLAGPRFERLLPATDSSRKMESRAGIVPGVFGCTMFTAFVGQRTAAGNACLKPGRPFLQRSGRSGDTGKICTVRTTVLCARKSFGFFQAPRRKPGAHTSPALLPAAVLVQQFVPRLLRSPPSVRGFLFASCTRRTVCSFRLHTGAIRSFSFWVNCSLDLFCRFGNCLLHAACSHRNRLTSSLTLLASCLERH
ncbi:hypothetical protein MTO96_011298 [Rhipicephalus appendiculatus]